MPDRRHEVTRIEGFSDGVFAIALALLVVSLEVPRDMSTLKELARKTVPFALMFAMVCWVWYEHRKFFQLYNLQDALTVFLNCALLFVVLFYVYPLKFLTTWLLGGFFGVQDRPVVTGAGDAGTLMLLYSSGVVLIFGIFALMYTRAWSFRQSLGLSAAAQITLRYGRRAHLISMSIGVTSVALVFIRSDLAFLAGIIYALMGPLHAWNGYVAGKARSALGAT
jgi:uncharacterized membrane protein